MSASLFWFERLPDSSIYERAAEYLRQRNALKFGTVEEARNVVDELLTNDDPKLVAMRSQLLAARDHLNQPLLEHDTIQLFGDLSEAKLRVAAFFTMQDVFQMGFRQAFEFKTMQFFTATGVLLTLEGFGERTLFEMDGRTMLSTGVHTVSIANDHLIVDAVQYGIVSPGQNVTVRDGCVFVDGLLRDPE